MTSNIEITEPTMMKKMPFQQHWVKKPFCMKNAKYAQIMNHDNLYTSGIDVIHGFIQIHIPFQERFFTWRYQFFYTYFFSQPQRHSTLFYSLKMDPKGWSQQNFHFQGSNLDPVNELDILSNFMQVKLINTLFYWKNMKTHCHLHIHMICIGLSQ